MIICTYKDEMFDSLIISVLQVGQKMIKDRSFEDNAEFFSTVFEIGRRHKILNPECMRTDYGKLVHMLMDSQNPDIQRDIFPFALIIICTCQWRNVFVIKTCYLQSSF